MRASRCTKMVLVVGAVTKLGAIGLLITGGKVHSNFWFNWAAPHERPKWCQYGQDQCKVCGQGEERGETGVNGEKTNKGQGRWGGNRGMQKMIAPKMFVVCYWSMLLAHCPQVLPNYSSPPPPSFPLRPLRPFSPSPSPPFHPIPLPPPRPPPPFPSNTPPVTPRPPPPPPPYFPPVPPISPPFPHPPSPFPPCSPWPHFALHCPPSGLPCCPLLFHNKDQHISLTRDAPQTLRTSASNICCVSPADPWPLPSPGPTHSDPRAVAWQPSALQCCCGPQRLLWAPRSGPLAPLPSLPPLSCAPCAYSPPHN